MSESYPLQGGFMYFYNIPPVVYAAAETIMSLFEIKCPMCKGTIWIDPSSGKIVDHQSVDHQKGDFNEFLKSRQKGVAWDDRFQKAREEEKKRKADIEQKFKQAKDSPGEESEKPMSSPFDWD
jgi:hypothetical protein